MGVSIEVLICSYRLAGAHNWQMRPKPLPNSAARPMPRSMVTQYPATPILELHTMLIPWRLLCPPLRILHSTGWLRERITTLCRQMHAQQLARVLAIILNRWDISHGIPRWSDWCPDQGHQGVPTRKTKFNLPGFQLTRVLRAC